VNALDKKIQESARELFISQGFNVKATESKVKELMICATAGWNTRAELIQLIKIAKGA